MQPAIYPQSNQPTMSIKPSTSNKVTRFDLINKNYILPQDNYPIQSSYTGDYQNNSNSRVHTQKISYPQNQVLPKGKFEGNSSYLHDYVRSQGTRGELMRRQGELKVGGNKFEGNSSYSNDYLGQGGGRQQKVTFPENKILPEGRFEEGSTYARNYINNPVQHLSKIKPEGQLKVGGAAFEGQSSYLASYQGRQNHQKSQKITYPQNSVLPKGTFEGTSTYEGTYQGQAEVRKNTPIKHEGQLKIGGQFYGQSSYSNNYYDKGVSGRPQKIQIPQNQVLPQGKFEQETTYAGNYVQNPIQINQKFKPEGQLRVGGGHFQGYSNYSSDFLKKEGQRAERVPLPHNDVMPKGDFVGGSSYNEAYIGAPTEKGKQFKPQGELKIGGKFEGYSSYAQDYESKGGASKREKVTYKDNEVLPKGQFEGHSTYQYNHYQMERSPNRQFKPEGELKIGGAFEGLSSYAANYVENKVQRSPQIKPQGELSLGEAKFQGVSSYGAEYIRKEGSMRAQRKALPQNDVLPRGQFVGNSTYQSNYVGGVGQKNVQIRPENNLSVGNTRFEGNSSYAVEYDPLAEGRRYLSKQGELVRRG